MIKSFSLLLILFIAVINAIYAGNPTQLRVDPPFWWTDMQNNEVQLMVYAPDIGKATVKFHSNQVSVNRLIRVENSNYLFIDLTLLPGLQPGDYTIEFTLPGRRKKPILHQFTFLERVEGSAERKGFTQADVIYLIMPDRFANGDPENDNIPGMLEPVNRHLPNGRHGGDLEGITQRLNYIQTLGFTAIWLNPVFENNSKTYSYHGYAITDFYNTDPRIGSLEDYKKFVEESRKRNIGVIKDMVFNHSGVNHLWKKDPPSSDWFNQWPEFTRTNYRASAIVDPYASQYDYNRMVRGWFDINMPDLNQHNPLLAKYLIQNTIWWIEYTGLRGIRIDTQPYPCKEFMAQWAKAVREEYPGITLVGEAWLNNPSMIAYYQDNPRNHDGYNAYLTGVFDFPLQVAIRSAFNEPNGWDTGIARLYEALTEDFLYEDPWSLVIFADNHDITRIFTSLREDFKSWKMAMTFLLTTRGIPLIYYGTELLMTGYDKPEHGEIRKDFPGGWPGDPRDAFTPQGRTDAENKAYNHLANLLQYRRNQPALLHGNLTHFVPNDGVYVYFRYTETDCVMVILNNNNSEHTLNMNRFAEITSGFNSAVDVLNNRPITSLHELQLQPRSAKILELKK